jgi:hypothetical protein
VQTEHNKDRLSSNTVGVPWKRRINILQKLNSLWIHVFYISKGMYSQH